MNDESIYYVAWMSRPVNENIFEEVTAPRNYKKPEAIEKYIAEATERRSQQVATMPVVATLTGAVILNSVGDPVAEATHSEPHEVAYQLAVLINTTLDRGEMPITLAGHLPEQFIRLWAADLAMYQTKNSVVAPISSKSILACTPVDIRLLVLGDQFRYDLSQEAFGAGQLGSWPTRLQAQADVAWLRSLASAHMSLAQLYGY